jgi:nucleoside 2-deoxyribosyltransferase
MATGTRYRAYLAAPLFNDMEREFNLSIERSLSPHIDVFVPQRDGLLFKELVAGGMAIPKAREIIFRRDLRAIEGAHILVAILDGRTVDEGVAFELGYACALGKFCIGLKSDDRVMLPTGDNPMIVAGCHQMCTDAAELIAAVRSRVDILSMRQPGSACMDEERGAQPGFRFW